MLTKETENILTKGGAFKELVSNPNWEKAKQEMISMLSALDTLHTFNMDSSATAIKNEIYLRKKVSEVILSWLEHIEGEAKNHDITLQAAKQRSELGIIRQ